MQKKFENAKFYITETNNTLLCMGFHDKSLWDLFIQYYIELSDKTFFLKNIFTTDEQSMVISITKRKYRDHQYFFLHFIDKLNIVTDLEQRQYRNFQEAILKNPVDWLALSASQSLPTFRFRSYPQLSDNLFHAFRTYVQAKRPIFQAPPPLPPRASKKGVVPPQLLVRETIFARRSPLEKPKTNLSQSEVLCKQLIKDVLSTIRNYTDALTTHAFPDDSGMMHASIIKKLMAAPEISSGFKCFLLHYCVISKVSEGQGEFIEYLNKNVCKHYENHIKNLGEQYFNKRKSYYPNMSMLEVMEAMFDGIMNDPEGFFAKPKYIKDCHVMPFPRVHLQVDLKSYSVLTQQKDIAYRIICRCLRLAIEYTQVNAEINWTGPPKTKGYNLAHALHHLCTRKDISTDFIMVILEGTIRLGGNSLCRSMKEALSSEEESYLMEAKARYINTHNLTEKNLEVIITNIVKKMPETAHKTRAWTHWSEAWLTGGFVSNRTLLIAREISPPAKSAQAETVEENRLQPK